MASLFRDTAAIAAKQRVIYNEKVLYKHTKRAIENTIQYGPMANFMTVYENNDCNVEVINMDSYSAIKNYYTTGKMAVLNFASFKHPGGMFLEGSTAQEEALCHKSNLYNILVAFNDTFYKENLKYLNRCLYTTRFLYTPDVIFCDNEPGVYMCDVITCAAPNCRYTEDKTINSDAGKAMRERIYSIFAAAYQNKVDTLILGAYGCGVFANDPAIVATIFKEAIIQFGGCFKNIIFAIPGGPNYDIFKQILSE